MARIAVTQRMVLALVVAVCAWAQGGVAAAPGARRGADRPRILVTNDDGYSTPGIAAVAEELSRFADVVVVAPLENASGSSQSIKVISDEAGIRLHEIEIGKSLKGYAIDGTPADCVWVGIRLLGVDDPFDFVVSGINVGENVGIAYLYSGTVGAAFQAVSQGIPAIAVSQGARRSEHKAAAEFAARVVKRVLAHPLAEGVVLSINVPDGEIRGAVAVPPGHTPFDLGFETVGTLDGETVYRPGFVRIDGSEVTGDVRSFSEGYITVTPLQLDRTHEPTLDTIAGWGFVDKPPR